MASIEIKTNAWPVLDVLPILLTDRSAKKKIIFATDSYADRGEGFSMLLYLEHGNIYAASLPVIRSAVDFCWSWTDIIY